jgi:hypothetical protein
MYTIQIKENIQYILNKQLNILVTSEILDINK